MKHRINLTAGDLVNHLIGLPQSTPVRIVGSGSQAYVNTEDPKCLIIDRRIPPKRPIRRKDNA